MLLRRLHRRQSGNAAAAAAAATERLPVAREFDLNFSL
jgi:hypothetical protein